MEEPQFAWPNGAKAAVSISFDDARPAQIEEGMPLLDRHGVRGTFYVTIAAMEQKLDAWKAAAERGHEIGNHTVSHPCSGNFVFSRHRALEDFTLDRMERELLDANEQIEELVGVTPRTFAYPCGQTFVGRGTSLQSYIPLVARHFLVGRGFKNESPADPIRCDLAYIPGVELDCCDWAWVQNWIDQAIAQGGWVTFVGHGVHPTTRQSIRPDVLDRLCALCADPANGVWIDTVAAVGAYVQAARQRS